VGVLLSGLLNDGAAGLSAVKRCGGVALVEDPADALADKMPLSVLRAVTADLIALGARIGDVLSDLAREHAGPKVPIPPEIRLEVDVAAGERVDSGVLRRIAAPSTLICPDRGGVMSQFREPGPLRFRCQVGHAKTADILAYEQENAVDEALRVALRVIEERAELVTRMVEDGRNAGRRAVAEMYGKRAEEYRRYAETIRPAVLTSMGYAEPSSDEGGQGRVAASPAGASGASSCGASLAKRLEAEGGPRPFGRGARAGEHVRGHRPRSRRSLARHGGRHGLRHESPLGRDAAGADAAAPGRRRGRGASTPRGPRRGRVLAGGGKGRPCAGRHGGRGRPGAGPPLPAFSRHDRHRGRRPRPHAARRRCPGRPGGDRQLSPVARTGGGGLRAGRGGGGAPLARGVPVAFTTGYDQGAIPPRYAAVPRCGKPVEAAEAVRVLFP
jgi:hypothetical protein